MTNLNALIHANTLVSRVDSLMHREHDTTAATQPKPEPASKGWARFIESKLHVGEDVWKVVGECTCDDLEFAAQERRLLAAEEHLTMASFYNSIGEPKQRHRGIFRNAHATRRIDLDKIESAMQEQKALTAEHLTIATYYEGIADAMRQHGVRTVAELPEMPEPPTDYESKAV